MPEPFARDLESTRLRLAHWLGSKLPTASHINISELVKPGASGFSSDTLIFDLSYREGGETRSRKAVIRIEPDPAAFRVFPFYDVGTQFELMKALGEKSDVPVPQMLWRESESAILGSRYRPWFSRLSLMPTVIFISSACTPGCSRPARVC